MHRFVLNSRKLIVNPNLFSQIIIRTKAALNAKRIRNDRTFNDVIGDRTELNG